MARTLKISLITIVSAVLLVLIGLTIVIRQVNPERVKQLLVTQVRQHTGRDLQINGKLSWHIFPSTGIDLHDVTLSNPKGFAKQDFAKISNLQVSIKTMSLLVGELTIDGITLKDATINLQVNGNGTTNWDDLSAKPSTDSSAQTAEPQSASAFRINSIDLHNANLNYQNKQTASNYQLSGLTINGNLSLGEASGKPSAQSILPIELLRRLRSQGSISFKKAQINNLAVNDFSTRFTASQGVLALNSIRADVYRGQLNASSKLDVSGRYPRYNSQQKLNNVNAEQLSKALGWKNVISGNLNASLDVAVDNLDRVPQTLQGKGEFKFGDGTISHLNLLSSINKVLSALKANPDALLPKPEEQTTKFTTLSGSITIKNGVIDNPDLALITPILDLNGKGTVNLNQQNLDYDLDVKLQQVKQDGKLAEIQKALGGTIPLELSGKLTSFSVSPNYKSIAKAVARSVITGQGGQIKKIGTDLKKKLGDIF